VIQSVDAVAQNQLNKGQGKPKDRWAYPHSTYIVYSPCPVTPQPRLKLKGCIAHTHRAVKVVLLSFGMLLRYISASIGRARHFSAAAEVEKAVTRGGGRDTLGRRLLSLVYSKRSAVIAIRKWKEEGHTVRKYELNRIVRELRKLKRYKHALEVFFFCFFFLFFFSFFLNLVLLFSLSLFSS